MKRIILLLFIIFTFVSTQFLLPVWAVTSLDSPVYEEIRKRYAGRIAESEKKFGPEVVALYYAFDKINGPIFFTLEDDDALMSKVLEVFRRVPDLPRLIHQNKNFSQAIAYNLQNASGTEMLNGLLRQDPALLGILARQDSDPYKAALALLFPGLNQRQLSSLNADNLRAICKLAMQNAKLVMQDENIKRLPNSAFNLYSRVVDKWGAAHLLKILEESPDLANALIPPLTFRGFIVGVDYPPHHPGETELRRAQDNYITFMRDLYLQARKIRSAAWATELCSAFASNVAVSLLERNAPAQEIMKFLLSLIDNNVFFNRLIIPSRCGEDGSNLVEFGQALLNLGNLISSGDILAELAVWHSKGSLPRLINRWIEESNSESFGLSMNHINSGELDFIMDNPDGVFLLSLAKLAKLRSSVSGREARLLDNLLYELEGRNMQYQVAVHFLAVYGDELLQFMESRPFNKPFEVAMHIIDFGYPTSKQLGLFECFANGRKDCPRLSLILSDRGRNSEDEIITHGLTFKERTGVDMETVIDTMDVTFGVALTVTTGVGAAKLALSIGRIAMRTALRNGIRAAAKKSGRMLLNTVKSSKKLTKRIRNIDIALKNLPRSNSGQIGVQNIENIGDRLAKIDEATYPYREALRWFASYMSENPEIFEAPAQIVEICPR